MTKLPFPHSRVTALILLTCAMSIGCTQVPESTIERAREMPAASSSAQTSPSAAVAAAVASIDASEASADTRSNATHCTSDEVAVFSCLLEGKEHSISLCMSGQARPDASRVRFVAGPRGRPDIVAANDPAGGGQAPSFKRTPLGFAGGTGGYAYSIAQAGQVHIIYSISGDDGLERQGLMLTDSAIQHVLTDQECQPDSVAESDDIDLLRLVRTWPTEARIEKNGLPASKP